MTKQAETNWDITRDKNMHNDKKKKKKKVLVDEDTVHSCNDILCAKLMCCSFGYHYYRVRFPMIHLI